MESVEFLCPKPCKFKEIFSNCHVKNVEFFCYKTRKSLNMLSADHMSLLEYFLFLQHGNFYVKQMFS